MLFIKVWKVFHSLTLSWGRSLYWNQSIHFYVIGTSVMKELKGEKSFIWKPFIFSTENMATCPRFSQRGKNSINFQKWIKMKFLLQLNYLEAAAGGVLLKKVFLKFRKLHRKTLGLSLFLIKLQALRRIHLRSVTQFNKVFCVNSLGFNGTFC